jgi:hypothetical protein
MGGACSTNGGKRNTYRILVGNLEGKRPVGRTRRRRMDNIVMWMARELLRNGPVSNPATEYTQGSNRIIAVSVQRPVNNLQLSALQQ